MFDLTHKPYRLPIVGPKFDRPLDGEPPYSMCVWMCVFNNTFLNNNNTAFVPFAFSSLYSFPNWIKHFLFITAHSEGHLYSHLMWLFPLQWVAMSYLSETVLKFIIHHANKQSKPINYHRGFWGLCTLFSRFRLCHLVSYWHIPDDSFNQNDLLIYVRRTPSAVIIRARDISSASS